MSAESPHAAPERPLRLLALFTARPTTPEEVPRLVEVCSQAYGEETPGASLRLKHQEGVHFTLEVLPGAMLKECELILRLHALDDPKSDHAAVLGHLDRLDAQIGAIARQATEGAQTYLALVGTCLAEQGRIRSFLNAGCLLGSALGAVFVDPAAVMITPEPGEWAEACEQSLQIEGAMAALREN